MVHKNRVWRVTNIDDPLMLARMLTSNTYTKCSGFRCRGYLFLNDSFSEDGAQEYGVIREDDLMEQVESITFSWCSEEDALRYILEIIEGKCDAGSWDSGIKKEQLQDPGQHKCWLCA